MQVCTSLQTDNHASTPPISFLQARSPSCRPTNSVKALKAQKTVTGYIFYHTSKILQKRKSREIDLFNAIPKTFKDAKFVADGTDIFTLSTKNFCLMLAVHLGLNSLYL